MIHLADPEREKAFLAVFSDVVRRAAIEYSGESDVSARAEAVARAFKAGLAVFDAHDTEPATAQIYGADVTANGITIGIDGHTAPKSVATSSVVALRFDSSELCAELREHNQLLGRLVAYKERVAAEKKALAERVKRDAAFANLAKRRADGASIRPSHPEPIAETGLPPLSGSRAIP